MKSKALEQFEDSVRKAEISMTPLIDMVFLLLIFFVVTTSFTKETGIKVEKAKASTTEAINENLYAVAISKEGAYWHNSKEYSSDQLIADIRLAVQKEPETMVLVIPDRRGEVEPLVTLLDRLRVEKITRFSLGTDRKKAE